MEMDQYYVVPMKKVYTHKNGPSFEVDAKYAPLKIIGQGSFGVVASFINQETGEKVAIKKIAGVFECPEDAAQIVREIILLRNLSHVNLISLKEVMIPGSPADFNDVYMVYELMDTDLDSIIRSPLQLREAHCECIMYQILSGLAYLHSANVLHRDLKPANIFINSNCHLKIGDMGQAITASGTGVLKTDYVVTRRYRAPELLLSCRNYNAAIDVWSAGCIFGELLGRRPLFPGKNTRHQLELILETIGFESKTDYFIDHPEVLMLVKSASHAEEARFASLFPEADPLAIDLLSNLLALNPSKRITAEAALQHPYFHKGFKNAYFRPAMDRMLVDVNDCIGEKELRGRIMDEIMKFHPEALMEIPIRAGQCAF